MTERTFVSSQAQPLVRGTAPDIIVRGRQMDVSERLRGHVGQRLDRIERFGIDIMRVDVEVTHHTNPRMADRAYTVELTCRVVGPVVRAEAHASDPYAAVDLAADHLSQRLQRAADRRRDRAQSRRRPQPPEPEPVALAVTPEPEHATAEPPTPDDADVVFEQGPIIVREKQHASAAMTIEDALDALESVGHDFYLFQDSATGLPSVVYRRHGWQYGLIRLTSS